MLNPFIFRLLQPIWYLLDAGIHKKPHYWAFSTHHLNTGHFIENQRAVFEQIKADPTIHKLVFYRGQPEDWQVEGAVNYKAVEHGSLRALWLLAQCKVVFLTHSISMDFSLRWGQQQFSVLRLNAKKRIIVNLWHGVALKRLLYTANAQTFAHTDRVPYRAKERRHYTGLIASSDIDSYAMATMFYPLNYRQIWLTGLPRNDFLTQPENELPHYIANSLKLIRQLKQDKKFVLYAPTYRQTSVSDTAYYYQFTQAEITALKQFLLDNNAILGYRPHYFKNTAAYFNLDQFIDNQLIFDMSQAVIPEYSALARACDLLVTDYSSVYIEALYLNKPVICFGYDIEHYHTQQDGLLYDMDLAFPGPVVKTFANLLAAIDERLHAPQEIIAQEQATAKRLFFRYTDANNAKRVIERVQASL